MFASCCRHTLLATCRAGAHVGRRWWPCSATRRVDNGDHRRIVASYFPARRSRGGRRRAALGLRAGCARDQASRSRPSQPRQPRPPAGRCRGREASRGREARRSRQPAAAAAAAAAKPAEAAKPAAAGKPEAKLGAQLIGKIEGPEIQKDVEAAGQARRGADAGRAGQGRQAPARRAARPRGAAGAQADARDRQVRRHLAPRVHRPGRHRELQPDHGGREAALRRLHRQQDRAVRLRRAGSWATAARRSACRCARA